jgi:hypothetical protein
MAAKQTKCNTCGTSMGNSIQDRASAYDQSGLIKREIDAAIVSLKMFRTKFLFVENPASIDTLRPDDIYVENSLEAGEFFHYLEYYFKPLGHPTTRSNVYRNISVQIADFKYLLHIVVDKKKSITEKVDAPWGKIKGLGDDKDLAKKIIFAFNYESGKVLPIFSSNHLKHFLGKIIEKPSYPTKYYTSGEEYERLMGELLKAKNNNPILQPWEITYFTRFLYENYPPPDREAIAAGERKTANVVTKDQLELGEFMKLLGELQKQGKINGEQFRHNRELWMNQPQERNALIKRLKAQLN